jgi:hypothetical protein
VTTPHPEPDALAELADLADGDQPTADQTESLAHVTDCPTCTDELAALRDVRETLGSLPPIPMPADVADRIEAALRAAQVPVGNVVPFAAPKSPQRARRTQLPYGAAAAVVIVLALVGGIAVVASGHNESKKSASAASASSAAAPAAALAEGTIIESGTNYTSTDIRAQVVAVVNGAIPGAAGQYPALQPGLAAAPASSAPAAATTSAAPSAAAAAPAATFAAPAAAGSSSAAAGPAVPGPTNAAAGHGSPTGPLADPAALAACVQTLVGKAESPVLVDYATFNGVPSTILVLPDPDEPGKLDIFVEANTSDCANQEFTFAAFLPPPSSPAS